MVPLALSALALGAFGFALSSFLSSRDKVVTDKDFIGGDGGPMIVLQATAIAQWQGANNFENSLMNGGSVETDYDVICASEDAGYAIKRHGQDMLVLDDSEWGAWIFTLPSGVIAIVQQFVGDDDINTVIERATQKRPSKSFAIDIQDTSLRLLVGAEDGSGKTYGYKDVPITPGTKRCDVFSSSDELVVIIKPI